ncbi:acetyl-CoA carboxylase biotin carboxyl carrier protein subunit [Aedoeadaptatus coxii]|uniref:Biotin-requiring enzyme n=1 Tax=Aedoeadaptatus coxii TaxID=755172 RepID=A0A134AC81_9FIRM|nr:acetyl-CoA carboxylase biotin carboxyl carrier protein subunit [Peptoniphilus coxii]KXB65258.1 Biotin-requiring enzyme [Peptoniphilus coxii]
MKSPLPGRIEEIRFKNGERVEEGSVVLILESMKMSIPLSAEKSGRIRYFVEDQEAVLRGEKLFIIEA